MRGYVIKRLIFLVSLVYLFSFLIYKANADDYMSGMAGVFSSGRDSLSETKLINLGHRESLLNTGFITQYEAGLWVDNAGNGRDNSGYMAFQFGVEAGDSVVTRVMFGPAVITHPDAYLGGIFQFTEDFFIGLTGRNGNIIGLKYKHLSSAGIEQPNIGRDFAGVEVSILL